MSGDLTQTCYARVSCPRADGGTVHCSYRYTPSAFETDREFVVTRNDGCTVCGDWRFTAAEQRTMCEELKLEHSYIDFETAFRPEGARA